MKKTLPVNPVKFLIDEAGRSELWVASAANCSLTSVTNWYADKPISRYYRPVLVRLMKREESRLAARVITDVTEARK